MVISTAELLSDEEMLFTAKEMNYSETTFILSETERDGGCEKVSKTTGNRIEG